jgi:hypothetical protein
MASTHTPTQILVLVKVTFQLGVPPKYTYLAFADGSPAQTVKVGPGDQIGWFVKVEAGPNWSQPAYTLTFQDPSILGTASIAVPNGGGSGFFTVQALSGGTKYTLAVSGVVPVSDPKIQVDPNGTVIIAARGPQYNVRWTAASNVMELENGGAWIPFPPAGLPAAVGTSIQFLAVLTPPADFEIVFPAGQNNGVWASPFDPNQSSFPAINHGAKENTDSLKVADQSDAAGTKFQFVAALTDGSLQSAPYAITLSAQKPSRE